MALGLLLGKLNNKMAAVLLTNVCLPYRMLVKFGHWKTVVFSLLNLHWTINFEKILMARKSKVTDILF